jgi:hypothetical protein
LLLVYVVANCILFWGKELSVGNKKYQKSFKVKKEKYIFFSDEAWFHVELTNGHFQQDSATDQTA